MEGSRKDTGKERAGNGPRKEADGKPTPSRATRRRKRRRSRRPHGADGSARSSAPLVEEDARTNDGADVGADRRRTNGHDTKQEVGTPVAANDSGEPPKEPAVAGHEVAESPTDSRAQLVCESVEEGVLHFRRRKAGPCSRFVLKECFD